MQIIQQCRKTGAKVLLMTYPHKSYSVSAGLIASRSIRQIGSEMKIPVLDNERIFNDLKIKHSLFANDNHCNETGYGLVALNIYNKIMPMGIFGQDTDKG